jgi:hypothetical protein
LRVLGGQENGDPPANNCTHPAINYFLAVSR